MKKYENFFRKCEPLSEIFEKIFLATFGNVTFRLFEWAWSFRWHINTSHK